MCVRVFINTHSGGVRAVGAEKISTQIDLENKALGESLKSPEFKEAAIAFLEKRAPDFRKFK